MLALSLAFVERGSDAPVLPRHLFSSYTFSVRVAAGMASRAAKPGGKNSLGLVKFMFPNDFNIYLHDTPAKSLFKQADRAASHGCIRLEHPDQLAQFALGWDAGRVQNAMENGGDNRTVNLPKKIPVYIVYFTAYAKDGQLYFADDLYGRDDQLEEVVQDSTKAVADTALRRPSNPSASLSRD